MHYAMEQTRYWMWTRRKFGGRPLLDPPTLSVAASSSYNESWEEQAFAEDSAGHLGGCVWPPRSYSCSFCRREFRSAQALGGHMNVHRRDRARLKQVSSPSSENHEADHHHQLNPCALPKVSSLVYNPNPNPNHGVIPSTLSPSRVSAASAQENRSDRTFVSPSNPSSTIEGHLNESLLVFTTRSLEDSIPSRTLSVLELKLGRENWRLREVGCRRPRDPSEDEEEGISKKRWKADPMFPFFLNPSPSSQRLVPFEVLKLKPSPVEELDLELRLGDPSKVK